MTFQEITEQMVKTYVRKNKDYGNSFSKLYENYGMTYPIIHLREKLNRIETLSQSTQPSTGNEPIEDSLLDLANYSVMTLLALKGEKN